MYFLRPTVSCTQHLRNAADTHCGRDRFEAGIADAICHSYKLHYLVPTRIDRFSCPCRRLLGGSIDRRGCDLCF